VGGRRVPGSGSQWSAKEDVKSDLVLVQDKNTKAEQITLKLRDLRVLEENAVQDGMRIPVFSLTFEGHGRYMLLSEDWLLSLLRGEHLENP